MVKGITTPAAAPSLRNLTILTALILIFTFVPWLGDTLFNTKGEPREAIVALSMLKSGNFILPESYGADIPYKPPFLAWMIAGASLLFTGGEVTEFSSRLPSAIATILMIIAGMRFYGRMSGNPAMAMGMAIVTVTCTEVFRAATACRVDMILTACMVMALYSMTSARERRGRPALSAAAIMLMTCAVLTKGPVGALLPCMIMWVYSLLRGDKPLRTTLVAATGFTLSLAVPALWYYAAYAQGGERFLNLVIEENFGRMTGSMSYGSHENPWWYNLMTLAAGLLPYTLLCLMALAAVKRRPARLPRAAALLARIRSLRPETLLALTSAVIVFLFYCFPKSKRSVYLLPIYPFMAYFIVRLGQWLIAEGRTRIVAVYAGIIAAAGAAAVLTACGMGLIDNAAGWILAAVCTATCIATLHTLRRPGPLTAAAAVASALTVYWVLGASVLPHILNEKSDIVIAREIGRIGGGRAVYSYNSAKMLRYYTAAFYLGDTVRLFAPEEGSSQSAQKSGGEPAELPAEGILIVSTADMPQWLGKYGREYSCDTLFTGSRKSCDTRAIPMIIGFRRSAEADAHRAAGTETKPKP